jgi:hypothetical protein
MKPIIFVKIDPTRGHGDGIWKVIKKVGQEYDLEHVVTKEQIRIFSAHTYRDMECAKVQRDAIEEQKKKNSQIGLNKHH